MRLAFGGVVGDGAISGGLFGRRAWERRERNPRRWLMTGAVTAALTASAAGLSPVIIHARSAPVLAPSELAPGIHADRVPSGLASAIRSQLGPTAIPASAWEPAARITAVQGGWRVTSRSGGHPPIEISASGMTSVAAGDRPTVSLQPSKLIVDGHATELSVLSSSLSGNQLSQRLGPVTSEFRTDGPSLEQRFVIPAPTTGPATKVSLELASPQRWVVDVGGAAVEPAGRPGVAYGGLHVTDANGRILPSQFAIASDGGVSIVVDTSSAVFPVTVDPTWTSTSKPDATLGDGRSSGGSFGYSVALSSDGTTALVGANGANTAYIFHVSSAGSWTSTSAPAATLSDPSGSDFGVSVALSADGTTALVGDDTGNAAYVFHVATAASWQTTSSPTATLVDGNPSGGGDNFGDSVALSSDGSVALIGADGANYTGDAYLFDVSSEGAWQSSSTPNAALGNGDNTLDYFGASVSLSSDGTTALVGAESYNANSGAAYIFHVASESAWATTSTPDATLTQAGTSGGYFGGSVALSPDGTTALSGAIDVNNNTGAAYIYHVAGEGSWASTAFATATLTNGDPSGADDWFGSSLAFSSDGATVLIGADGENGTTGAAYVFSASSEGAWASSSAPDATLQNGDGANTGDWVGSGVALSSSGSTAVVGAYGVNPTLGLGAAYVFNAPQAAPVVSSVTPDTGPLSGHMSVVLSGSGFSTAPGGTSVDFGSEPALSVSCPSSSSCTAEVPAGITPGMVDVTVSAGGATSATGSSDQFSYYDPGFLRIESSPAVPSRITVDGAPADTWGAWVKTSPGPHTVCFGQVPGYEAPACQSVTVSSGATSTVTGTFVQRGFLRVETSPALPGQITIDSYPADDYGFWADVATGSHTVCFGAVAGYAPPPCQTVTVGAGATTTATGTYGSSPGAADQSGVGFLRVATSPAVPSRISVDGQVADTWGVWVKLPSGAHTVCFGDVAGYETPACQTAQVTVGGTTTVTGTFSQRGYLHVSTSPASAGTIYLNGLPADDWGMWSDVAVGDYTVCFGVVSGYSNSPACQSATITPGATTTITGSYT